MSCPCFYEPRNAVVDKPQNPRPVRQVSQRTNDARAPLPGGLRRVSYSTRGSGSVRMSLSEKDIEHTVGVLNTHARTAHPPKSILKHPTKRFPFEDPVAVQRATGLRFEMGKLSSEFTLDGHDMVEVQAQKRNRGGRQPRDSMVVVDEARTRARRRFLSEKGSREALLGEQSE